MRFSQPNVPSTETSFKIRILWLNEGHIKEKHGIEEKQCIFSSWQPTES